MQRLSTRSFGPDDYAIIPGLVSLDIGIKTLLSSERCDDQMLYIGWTAMAAYVNLHAGVGKPLWEITVGEFSVWFKVTRQGIGVIEATLSNQMLQGIIGSAWIYPAMSMSIRTSILLTYDRIFAKSMPTVRFIIRFLLSLQVIYLIVYSILPAFICRPLNKAWHPLERQQYFNDWYYYYLQVALYSTSMAFDVILLVLPLYPISQLQMALRKRIGIGSILVLGTWYFIPSVILFESSANGVSYPAQE